MTAPVAVVIDKGVDLLPEITGQVEVVQQEAVLDNLMPALDLSLSLRMVWRPLNMIDFLLFQPFSKLARDQAGPAVAEQPRLVADGRLGTARRLQSRVQRIGNITGCHRCAELPGDDGSAVIDYDRADVKPAPADHLQIDKAGLS